MVKHPTFHPVRRRFYERLRGYEIWFGNRPVVTLKDGLDLSRREAYALAKEWNG